MQNLFDLRMTRHVMVLLAAFVMVGMGCSNGDPNGDSPDPIVKDEDRKLARTLQPSDSLVVRQALNLFLHRFATSLSDSLGDKETWTTAEVKEHIASIARISSKGPIEPLSAMCKETIVISSSEVVTVGPDCDSVTINDLALWGVGDVVTLEIAPGGNGVVVEHSMPLNYFVDLTDVELKTVFGYDLETSTRYEPHLRAYGVPRQAIVIEGPGTYQLRAPVMSGNPWEVDRE